jgi:molecular chaperone GrpE
MDANDKERLVDEFRACLDGWEEGENDPSDGEESEPSVNLALLFSELSVLRNEVRVEARQFKTALDEMRALTEMLGEQNQRLMRDLERAREAEGNAQRQAERGLLLDMLDVRDRIAAAVDVYEAYRAEPSSFFSRLVPKETRLAQGLGAGMALTLQRLDDSLVERRVRAIEAIGNRLDPNTMRAVGVKSREDCAPGGVLEEVRRGYLRDDKLLRLAEVIVNKRESES